MAPGPVVTDIRGLLFLLSGELKYKLRHSDEWQNLSIRRTPEAGTNPKYLYSVRIKIKSDKYKHLQEFQPLIPAEFHEYYNSLPHH